MTKNTIKEEPKQEKKNVKSPKGGNIITRTVGSVMSGSFLSREGVLRNLPFIFFLTFIALCYIANGYYAEEQIRSLNTMQNKLKELRSEYIVSKSDLMFVSKQSEVAKRAAPLGIKESLEPPKEILVKKSPAEAKQEQKNND
ncbi:MAG: hypothetical protein FD123_1618 [Bacteroidetes bacterium]|nr:MAG: hypothetical protein FD123_1618 [Bacteroidota bacterium]